MFIAAVIFMCVGLTITWGGLLYAISIQQRRARRKKNAL